MRLSESRRQAASGPLASDVSSVYVENGELSHGKDQCRSGPTRRAIGKEVLLQGWIRTRRDSKGGFSFLEVNDGSCQGNVQILAEAKLANYESEIKKLGTGCARGHRGHGAGLAGQGAADRDSGRAGHRPRLGRLARRIPSRRKGISFEFLRTIAHLRPRTNTFGAIARLRNCVCRSIHDFFQEQGFLYIHPPIITASDCEGAGAMFRVTTIDLAKPPMTERRRRLHARTSSAGPTYLTVSGQLEAEIFACALGKVYTFGPTFRAENSNTTRHLSEFWMIEPEMAFFELTDNMTLAEAFIKRIIRDALEHCAEDMQFFDERDRKGPASNG